MTKRLQKDSGEEQVTAKSRPMMNLIAKTPSFVVFNFSEPGKKHYGSQDPWKSVAGEDGSGRPNKETHLFETSAHHVHEQFMESFSSTDCSNWITTVLGLLKSGKLTLRATTHDRSRRHDQTSWRMVRQIRPDREEILLDGTAQSARYGETLRDGSRLLKKWQILKISSWEAIRSFVNRVNDQVRTRQRRISNVCRRRRRTFYYLGNVYGCNSW